MKLYQYRILPAVLVLILFILLAGGCASSESTPTPAVEAPAATDAPADETPATPAPTPTEAVQPGVTFRNPVLRNDFPDPHIIEVDGTYYAYATNSAGRNVQIATSENLVDWNLRIDAMPALPSWVRLSQPNVWAPEVMYVQDQYVLYFTARSREDDRQCIGVAVSDRPDAGFRDTGDEPFICQVEEGGSIDAHPFRDGDQLYLYWKNDGNCCSRPTYIYVQEMSSDGLELVGEPVRLIRNTEVWESHVIEAPSMLKHEDSYYLFYSANNYAGVEYAVGYAVCESPLGPCEKAEENPILETLLERPPVIGPGHQTFVEVGDQTWMVYHAWEVTSQGRRGDRRFMWIDRLEWEDGKPVVMGPTTGVQAVP
jgi:beta-xylosidase